MTIPAYEHRQRSPRVLALFSVTGLGALTALWTFSGQLAAGPRLTLAASALVMFVAAIVFSSLTIRVGEDRLAWHFGRGVAAKSIPLAAIARAEPTTTGLLEGWGMHLTTRGWLYNVAGRQAVLITLRDGRRFLLGSDETEALTQAIRQRSSPTPSTIGP